MMRAFVFLLLGVCCSTTGQMLLKHGVGMVTSASQPLELWPLPLLITSLFSVFTNPFVFGGFVLSFLGAIFWLAVLSRLELSVAYPMLAISYALVIVLSWLVFGENVTLLRFAGAAVIISGVALIGLSYQRERQAKEKLESTSLSTLTQPE